jgi:hypothetical protein
MFGFTSQDGRHRGDTVNKKPMNLQPVIYHRNFIRLRLEPRHF